MIFDKFFTLNPLHLPPSPQSTWGFTLDDNEDIYLLSPSPQPTSRFTLGDNEVIEGDFVLGEGDGMVVERWFGGRSWLQ